jgi:hypothetical protein
VVNQTVTPGHHWIYVRWTEGDAVREAMDSVSAHVYGGVHVGGPVEIVGSTPPLYLYGGQSRAQRLWPLASMAAAWIVLGGMVVYQIAVPAMRQRWLVRYGVAASGQLQEIQNRPGVATLIYAYTPSNRPAMTGRMLVPAKAASSLRVGQNLTILHAKNPRSSVVYEGSDFDAA